jgi:hypothetical protein
MGLPQHIIYGGNNWLSVEMSMADYIANHIEWKIISPWLITQISIISYGTKEFIPFCAGVRAAQKGVVGIKSSASRILSWNLLRNCSHLLPEICLWQACTQSHVIASPLLNVGLLNIIQCAHHSHRRQAVFRT